MRIVVQCMPLVMVSEVMLALCMQDVSYKILLEISYFLIRDMLNNALHLVIPIIVTCCSSYFGIRVNVFNTYVCGVHNRGGNNNHEVEISIGIGSRSIR